MVCESQSCGGLAARPQRCSVHRYTSRGRPSAAFGALWWGAALHGGLLLLASAAAPACAGAAPAPSLDQAFARIQVHEAAIERARLDVQRSESSCAAACDAAISAAGEQAALCRIAREVDDPDALTRCARARSSANGLKAQSATRCRCR
jgi:hypothetical protein